MTEPNVEQIYKHQEEKRKKENAEIARKKELEIKKLVGAIIDSEIDLRSGDLELVFENGRIIVGVLAPIDEDFGSGQRHIEVEVKE